MTRPILIAPGIGNSGPQHWQSLWEASAPNFHRVNQQDWDHPVCSEWVAALEQTVAAHGPDTVIVAHSLACLVVAHWAAATHLSIHGAILVAVPDPSGPAFPADILGFATTPEIVFPFPSLVVASSNDPYGTLDYAQQWATTRGSRFITIGDAGHINAASGLGAWPQGRQLLESLL